MIEWPPTNSASSTCSTTSSCPIIAFLISRSRRSRAVPSLSSSCSSEIVSWSTAMCSSFIHRLHRFTNHRRHLWLTVRLFVTTIPVLSHIVAQLRARAAPRASPQAGGPTHETPPPHCSLLPQHSAAPVPTPLEAPSAPVSNL